MSDNDKKYCAKIFDEIQNSLQDFEFDIDKYGIEIKNTLKNFNIEDWCHKFSDKIQ